MTSTPARSALFEWGLSVIAVILAIGNLALASVLIFGAPSRTSGPSFNVLKDLAPVRYWGVAFGIAGLCAVFGQLTHRRLPARVGHLVSMTLCLLWVGGFAYGLTNKAVSATGLCAYGIIAAVHGVIAVVCPPRPQ